MNSNTISSTLPQSTTSHRWRSYAELTKIRISTMVLFTFCVAGVMAAGVAVPLATLFWATVGMLLIASSGNAMNMYLERYTDYLMPRTANRPLPAQKLSATEVVLFAAICFGASMGVFLTLVNWQTAVCGLLTWILYVCVYTPLKTRTMFNTEVGALPGALPVLMGSLATTGTVTAGTWFFFLVLLIWQFPHFMSIAWLYRNQYRDGGLQMITVVDPTGRLAGRKAVATCVLLMIVSCLPALTLATPWHSLIFVAAAIVLGLYYLKASIRFANDRGDQTARRLLKVSVLYLPLYMFVLVMANLG
jgi:protoheme IX farnesyltransferase